MKPTYQFDVSESKWVVLLAGKPVVWCTKKEQAERFCK